VEGSVLVAIISSGAALAVAAMTYAFNKKREREAEWRKVKLDHYREYMAALSAVVGRRSNDMAQTRYSDAVNTMALVAPPDVLRALYAFQEEIRMSNANHSQANHDLRLGDLLRTIRQDVHPKPPDDTGINFMLMDAPPSSGRVTS
jgi:hypothetical protein